MFTVKSCVAHMVCKVVRGDNSEEAPLGAVVDGHYIINCQIYEAYVRKEYWSNNNFIAPEKDETSPPYLSFLGSQRFGYVTKSVV